MSDEGHAGGGARRILLNAGYLTIADLAGKFASFALYVFMARKLGASDFGIFTFSFVFVSLVTMPATFGQDSLLTREVAKDRTQADLYFSNMLGLKVSLAVPALGIGLAVLSATSSEKTVAVSVVLGLGAIAQLLMNTCFAIFQSFERLGPPAVVLISQRLLTAALGIGLLAAGVGVLGVSLVFLGTGVLALCLAVALMFRMIVRASLKIDVTTWRSLMRAAIPIGIASTASLVLFRIDTVMLAAFKPARDVGNYGAAYRLLETTLFLTWSVSAAVFPLFARLTSASEPRLGVVLERALKLVSAFTLPLAAGAALFAGQVVHLLYGDQYTRAENALSLLAPAIALYPLAYLAGELLVAQQRQAPVTITYLVVAAENILLNLVLIPRWSLDGAAVGTSISELLVAISLVYFSLRHVGHLNWRRVLAGPLVSTAIALGVIEALKGTFVVALVAGVLVYGCLLLGFERRAFPEDARVFLSVVRRS
ncbi:MAG: flippase [Gaiellaceae bacterium]